MNAWQEKQDFPRKPAPMSLCPPQGQQGLTWARTRAAAVEIWRLTVRATALPMFTVTYEQEIH
jgi:hypothetical protein